MKKRWWIIGGIIVLGIVIAVVAMNSRNRVRDAGVSTTTTSNKSNNDDQFIQQYGGNCDKNAVASFTSPPLAIDKIYGIEPLGKMSDGHVTPIDHVYVSPLDQNAADNTYDVLAPSASRVVRIDRMPAQYIGDQTGVKLASDDFRLVLAHDCQYYSIFIHVHKLAAKLDVIGAALKPNEHKDTNIVVEAGEVIAHIGGNPFDWTLIDTKTTLTGLKTPSLYTSEPWKVHTIDPFSVYAGTLQAQLQAKSFRTTAPFGGKLDYDQAGKLIGSWFKQGTNGYAGASQDRYWDGHLAIAPNNIDPTTTIVSIGNWDGTAKQFAVKGLVDPTVITPASEPVTYELMEVSYTLANGSPFSGGQYSRDMKASQNGAVVGLIMFQVMAGEKLKVEKFVGKTKTQVTAFTSAAENYER